MILTSPLCARLTVAGLRVVAAGAILACDAPLTSTAAVELAAAGAPLTQPPNSIAVCPLTSCMAGGVVAVVQPGGAARDSALIELANEYGLTMIFTHHRPFRRRKP